MPMRSETELIQLIERLAGPQHSAGLRVGIGDDAAVLTCPGPAEELLATTDQLVENKHFVHGQHPPDALGHKLLVRGLSDIAAMGGTPSWFLLSLALPSRLNDSWIEKFLEGLLAAREKSEAAQIVLAGGDVSGSELFSAHVTVVGTIPKGQALLRSGCRADDAVYVSGHLGGSALGLERLAQGALDDSTTRHLWPSARLALGSRLRELGVRAALDISDGLSTDLNRLAQASSVRIRLDFEALPRFPEATDSQVLHGGEEYELLFSAPRSMDIPQSFQGVPLTRIGAATSGSGVVLVREGQETVLVPGGFEHLVAGG
ncbi:MAG: thiamine-phosphate kinase [Acidobacteria bacterium]|nr:thiamine-phosphate kinase [Acidobacteriota bacterium]MDA1233797.1 thiamine-phosphate kinase [Acidobacteriota bacterium]